MGTTQTVIPCGVYKLTIRRVEKILGLYRRGTAEPGESYISIDVFGYVAGF